MKSHSTYLTLVLALLALAKPCVVQAQERYLYWIGAVEAEEIRGNTIFRYTIDSGVMDTLVQAKVISPGFRVYFYHLTLDTLRQHIYWTDSGGMDADGIVYLNAIRRASLDGSNAEVFVRGAVCGTFAAPQDIEIDINGEWLYWGAITNCERASLYSLDLATYTPDPLLVLPVLPVRASYSVNAIELDLQQQMIYWTNNDGFDQREPLGILRAPTNDTESDEYIVQGNICDIALAPTLGKIYWTRCERRLIRRANLDGTEAEDVLSDGIGRIAVGDASHLAIDHVGEKLYWSVPSAGIIRRANLDGSEVEDVVSGLVVPRSIALGFGGAITTAVEPGEVLPQRIATVATYPNPFATSTTISYTLTEASVVRLQVFDVLGREVQTLVNGYQSPGIQSIAFTEDGLPSGLYIYRLEAGESVKTGTIQLVN